MANCLFAYPDRTLSATLSGGSWSATLPLANLRDRLLTKVARSVDAAPVSTTFDADLGTSRELRLVALLASNLSAAATIRVKVGVDSGFAQLLYDTGAVTMPWAALDAEALEGWRPDVWHVLPAGLSGRFLRLEIADSANPAGYVELGRCLLMPGWQPEVNLDWGNPIHYDHSGTTIDRALGGPRYAGRRKPQRVQTVSLPYLTSVEAHQRILEMQRQLGRDAEVYFVHDPDETDIHVRQKSFLATLAEVDALETPYLGNHSTAFNLLEVI